MHAGRAGKKGTTRNYLPQTLGVPHSIKTRFLLAYTALGMLTSSSTVSARSLRPLSASSCSKARKSKTTRPLVAAAATMLDQQPLLHGDTFFLDNFAIRQVCIGQEPTVPRLPHNGS
jgi:hypothetical protein